MDKINKLKELLGEAVPTDKRCMCSGSVDININLTIRKRKKKSSRSLLTGKTIMERGTPYLMSDKWLSMEAAND
ncbi:hypothetical protein BOW53_02835 [Solemya pervernicosa gill symbiont]|uniref:Uncharacterized protein n=1 Tax=Solemya pervernicosa gill symbiont TaxID=642797 RepID=A0A1T2L9C4_9GAMM|nr:hypothetical protein [Solemya pervernicosa gill symbiont]OOZ41632.1 hypothetical protein BOW53_02835 [Solemya pervernicosa gill symbiont]